MRNSSAGTRVIPLHFWTCFFLDSDDGSYASTKPSSYFKCRSQGKFLAGSDESGQYYGSVACIVICVLIYLIGIFGVGSNIVNALVLQKSLKGASESLKRLLITLAVFESFASFLSIFLGTVIIAILENANRSQTAFYMFKIGHVLYSFGRVGAIYISILVTIERYLVIAFPIQSKIWLTPLKSKIYLAGVILLAAMLDITWIFNADVASNNYAALSPNTSLAEFPYILKNTEFSRTIYPHVRYPQLVLSYIMPFPLILLFNGLLYLSIYKWSKSRQALSKNLKKEINVAKMISIVVLVLLVCHAVSCIIVFAAQVLKVIYRELMLLQILAVTVSSAVNFIVYYACGKPFREEFSRLVISSWARVSGRVLMVDDKPSTPTQSTKDTEDSSGTVVDEKVGAATKEDADAITPAQESQTKEEEAKTK